MLGPVSDSGFGFWCPLAHLRPHDNASGGISQVLQLPIASAVCADFCFRHIGGEAFGRCSARTTVRASCAARASVPRTIIRTRARVARRKICFAALLDDLSRNVGVAETGGMCGTNHRPKEDADERGDQRERGNALPAIALTPRRRAPAPVCLSVVVVPYPPAHARILARPTTRRKGFVRPA